ncbi:hypothetical protein B0T20DRAFT_359506, partial [Sordaria brevicollis]
NFNFKALLKFNKEFEFDRNTLYYLLIIRLNYGDFKDYYKRFEYENAVIKYFYGN